MALRVTKNCIHRREIYLVISTAGSLNIPAAVGRLVSIVIEVWFAVVGPADEVARTLGVRVAVALAHRAGRAVAAIRPGRALIVGPDAVAVAPVMAVSLGAVLAGRGEVVAATDRDRRGDAAVRTGVRPGVVSLAVVATAHQAARTVGVAVAVP